MRKRAQVGNLDMQKGPFGELGFEVPGDGSKYGEYPFKFYRSLIEVAEGAIWLLVRAVETYFILRSILLDWTFARRRRRLGYYRGSFANCSGLSPSIWQWLTPSL